MISNSSLRIVQWLAFPLLFVANPPIAVLLSFVVAILLSKDRISGYESSISFALCLSAFLGLINATKVPENDLVWYVDGYALAGYLNFFDYIESFGINGQGVEVIFPAINYVLYYIFDGGVSEYVFFVTFLYYFLISFAVCRFGRANNLPMVATQFSILIFCLAPNIFSTSALILRQNIASAVVIYCMVELIFFRRYVYILLFSIPFIHASGAFFLVLMFLPGMRKQIDLKSLPIYLCIVLFILNYQSIATFLANSIPGGGLLSYVLTRASSGTTYELPPLTPLKILFGLLLVVSSFLYTYWLRRAGTNRIGMVFFSNFLAITFLFIISNLEFVELSVRFNFYFLGFFPLVAATVLSLLPRSVLLPSVLILQFPIYIYFYNALFDSPWAYEGLDSLLVRPAFNYF